MYDSVDAFVCGNHLLDQILAMLTAGEVVNVSRSPASGTEDGIPHSLSGPRITTAAVSLYTGIVHSDYRPSGCQDVGVRLTQAASGTRHKDDLPRKVDHASSIPPRAALDRTPGASTWNGSKLAVST